MKNETERLKEIIEIIKKHNIIKDRSPKNIRETIEELGPTFIKMGQILSSRNDFLNEEMITELKKLKGSVLPMNEEQIKEILNEEYKGKENEIFLAIENKPIGSASIAQIHKAKLKNGEIVALKIQRKNIYEMMTLDSKLLKKAISILQIDKILGNVIDIKSLIDEMYETAKEEMDFLIEAKHIEEFSENNKDISYIKGIKIYKEYTTRHILVMEFIDAPLISEKEKLIKLGYDLKEVTLKLADNYIKQAIDDGFYHADPHSDNIKIQDGKIVYLDFGMMGRLSNRNKDLLNKCIVAILKNDIDDIAHILKILNVKDEEINYMKLKSDIKLVLDKNKTTEIKNINIKEFAKEMFLLLNENKIKLPKDITMLIRGIVVIEGTIEEINPDVNLIEVLKNRLSLNKIITEDNIKEIGYKIVKGSNDIISIPSETLSILKGINNGELKFNIELNDSKHQLQKIENILYQIIITILDVALILGISIMTMLDNSRESNIYYIYIILSIIFTLWLFYKMVISKIKNK